ncbi:MAG: 4Fe-4S binding protein [bacterium]|nr:4Fe-4S binding protein [bacterium]
MSQPQKPYFLWKHLNKLRWVSLIAVFSMLILLPFLHVYQTFVSAHAYDLLADSEKQLYDVMEVISSPFVSDPEHDLDGLKGTTWSGNLFGLKLSDPLAVLGQIASGLTLYWPFIVTALIPVALTMLLGRFFCGWICPATMLYELNSLLGGWLAFVGYRTGNRKFDKRLKYGVLAVGLVLSALTGAALFATVYPPAIIGREIYYAIALGGFGAGVIFFAATLVFDLLVARRGFCRYICPGGALYSLLGRYRPVRIKRIVESCNDCAKCNVVCEFGLDPLHDNFGQECNNCTTCIAVCPTDAMTFILSPFDHPPQGPGHLGKKYRRLYKEQADQIERVAE